MWISAPFVLFVLVELDHDTINHVLQEAVNGAALPLLWLATDNYENAPQKEERKNNHGQTPPISADWTSSFLGYKLENVAKWIQDKTESVDLDSNHFAILDVKATDGSVVVCKIGDSMKPGKALSLVRKSAYVVSPFLDGMEPGTWEEQFESVPGRRRHAEVDYGKSES